MKEKPKVVRYYKVNQEKLDETCQKLFEVATELASKEKLAAMYEPIIQQERSLYYDGGYAQAVKDNQELIGTREVFWQNEIQQAKADVARGIIEDIDYIAQHEKLTQWLKDKWLEENNENQTA